MTMKSVLLIIFVALATTGSSCINEDFLVVVNYPFTTCVAISSGSKLSYEASDTVALADYIDASYLQKMKGARYYDIRVSTKGTYNGSVVGEVKIDGYVLVTYSGAWSSFATPQSILSSSLVAGHGPGIEALVRKLNEFVKNKNAQAVVGNGGTLTGEAVPTGLSVCVEILAQVDAQVN